MSRLKLSIYIVTVLALLGTMAWAANSWGVHHYLNGLFETRVASPNAQNKNDIFLPAQKTVHGSALLLHGLNFDAEKMRPIGELLASEGFDVLIPRLSGHRGLARETHEDPSEMWRSQITDWQSQLRPPLICAGYSIGALLVVDGFLRDHLPCEKFVLFAPAFAAHIPAIVTNWLDMLIPYWLEFPSAIPARYRHLDRIGLGPTFAAVKIMQQIPLLFLDQNVKKIPSGLVFLDPRDGVIDARKVNEIVKTRFLPWRVFPVQTQNLNENHAFHLIVDQEHLGAEQWDRVTDAIRGFLRQ